MTRLVAGSRRPVVRRAFPLVFAGAVICAGACSLDYLQEGIRPTAPDASEDAPNASTDATPQVDATTQVDADAGYCGSACIAAGDRHTCALRGGELYCWGANDQGQLGAVAGADILVPTKVAGFSEPLSVVVAGEATTCVLGESGRAYCMGENGHLELGRSGPSSATPLPVVQADGGVPPPFVAIAGTHQHFCARTATSDIYCWGSNDKGACGVDESATTLFATRLGLRFDQIGAGQSISCGVRSDGAWCWGDNSTFQLNGWGGGLLSEQPIVIAGLNPPPVQISVGAATICARTTASGAVCWGSNNCGHTGEGPLTIHSLVQSGVQAIITGGNHSGGDPSLDHQVTCLILLDGGSVECLGSNARGELGRGDVDPRSCSDGGSHFERAPVVGLTGIVDLAIGQGHVCALDRGGDLQCWGANDHGQLGDQTKSLSPTPKKVVFP